jgi:hypothetical protein
MSRPSAGRIRAEATNRCDFGVDGMTGLIERDGGADRKLFSDPRAALPPRSSPQQWVSSIWVFVCRILLWSSQGGVVVDTQVGGNLQRRNLILPVRGSLQLGTGRSDRRPETRRSAGALLPA